MKFILLFTITGILFYLSYLWDLASFKRELKRRNLRLDRYEKKIIHSSKNK